MSTVRRRATGAKQKNDRNSYGVISISTLYFVGNIKKQKTRLTESRTINCSKSVAKEEKWNEAILIN